MNTITSNAAIPRELSLYDSLFVNRGSPGENMTTEALQLIARKNQTYCLRKNGLQISVSGLYAIDLENQETLPGKIQIPPYLEVAANWDKTPHESGSENNILGDNGFLILPSEIIDVPVVEADTETLAYYGALLIHDGDLVQFSDAKFPIFKMTVGPRYIEDFLMTDRGGGFYLEYHRDKPHFHMPIQGGGCYILARWKDDGKDDGNDDGKKLHITGFKIPDGQAVYTKKGAIHCDAALTGTLLVGYDQAEDCSTVLLRTSDLRKTKVNFYTPYPSDAS